MKPEKTVYDLAVIGGGIAGAAIARDAALRGIRVVLFEKNTFGSGTSSKSSRLIHGGIRYLEIAWDALKTGRLSEAWKNFCFVFSALKECRILQKIAPGLIRPIPILIPIYKEDPRGRWSIFAGALLYSALAALSGEWKPVKIFLNPSDIAKELPGLKTTGLLGGTRIWDRTVDDRALVRATMASAARHGAMTF